MGRSKSKTMCRQRFAVAGSLSGVERRLPPPWNERYETMGRSDSQMTGPLLAGLHACIVIILSKQMIGRSDLHMTGQFVGPPCGSGGVPV